MTEVTAGVYAARKLAMDEVCRQATAAGANDMAILTLTHQIDHHEYDSSDSQHFFIVSMHVLDRGSPRASRTPVMSINLGA